jgi:hypothetical protein
VKKVNLGLSVFAATILIVSASIGAITTTMQKAYALYINGFPKTDKAPVAVSGDNDVYVVWSTDKGTPNKNAEVMFKASTDGGKTFGSKSNLSNTPTADSVNAEIAAAGGKVYVSWWERANQTSIEPVMKVSNDNGKTFGDIIKLSEK